MACRLAYCPVVAFLLILMLLPVQGRSEELSAPAMLHPVEQDDLYGYADDTGEIVIPCQWQYAGEFRGAGYAMVSISADEDAIIDRTGSYVIRSSCIEEGQAGVYCGGMHTGVFWLDNGQALGCFDVTNGCFSGYVFHREQDIWWCSRETDLVRISYDGENYGYYNSASGHLQIPCIFTGWEEDYVDSFASGYAIDRIGDTFVVLNQQGTLLPLAAHLTPTSLGDLITVRDVRSGLYGYCSLSGQCVIPPRFTDAAPFCNGYASVCVDGKWAHIDILGQLQCTPRYDEPYFFNGVSFLVTVDGQQQLIDTSGQLLRAFPEGDSVSYMTDRLMLHCGCNGLTGLVDLHGRDLISMDQGLWIDPGQNVSEGFLIVQNQQGRWGYASTDGEVVCCLWDRVESFLNGWARVAKGQSVCWINHDMMPVFPR